MYCCFEILHDTHLHMICIRCTIRVFTTSYLKDNNSKKDFPWLVLTNLLDGYVTTAHH